MAGGATEPPRGGREAVKKAGQERREVVKQGAGRAGEQETAAARAAGWIEVRALQHPEVAQRLSDTSGLGSGESEAIALAQECAAELLLLDDDQVVKRARELGLVVRRTPGILGLAKEQGLITTVKEPLDALRAEGLWLSVEAYYRILRDLGEESYGNVAGGFR